MVLFLISNFYKKGVGGHYYTLLDTAEEMSKYFPLIIVIIGNKPAMSLDIWNDKKIFLKTSLINFSDAIKRISKICKDNNVKIVHAFDLTSCYFGRLISLKLKIPCVFTKCGGPPPYKKLGKIGYYIYPHIPIQCVLHEEDFMWFYKRGRYKILEIVRERVKRPEIDFSRLNTCRELIEFYSDAELKIMRIGRIAEENFIYIKQAINFTKKLRVINIKAKLAIIGDIDFRNIEFLEEFREINKLAGEETKFFTDKKFTLKAVDFLPLADVVIGSGRNFMESCALGKIVMCAVSDANFPALVTKENIKYFEEKNFSSRVRKNYIIDPDRDYLEYIKILTCSELRKKIRDDMIDVFNSRYDVKIGVNKYLSIYDKTVANNFYEKNLYDIYFHLLQEKFQLLKNFLMTNYKFVYKLVKLIKKIFNKL